MLKELQKFTIHSRCWNKAMTGTKRGSWGMLELEAKTEREKSGEDRLLTQAISLYEGAGAFSDNGIWNWERSWWTDAQRELQCLIGILQLVFNFLVMLLPHNHNLLSIPHKDGSDLINGVTHQKIQPLVSLSLVKRFHIFWTLLLQLSCWRQYIW